MSINWTKKLVVRYPDDFSPCVAASLPGLNATVAAETGKVLLPHGSGLNHVIVCSVPPCSGLTAPKKKQGSGQAVLRDGGGRSGAHQAERITEDR